MHVDSLLSANIQFADWVAAAVTRGIERQLLVTEVDRNEWVPRILSQPLRRAFTRESKLHLHNRSHPDIHGAAAFSAVRPLAGRDHARRIGDSVSPEQYQLMKEAAERAASLERRRKAFFANTPDESEPADDGAAAPLGFTLGGSGGLKPEMGLKF